MRAQDNIRTFFFIAFFAIGSGVLAFSIFCEELLIKYQNAQSLEHIRHTNLKLESAISDYDVLINKLENDPNFIKRVASVTFGITPNDPNTVYPRAGLDPLNTAREILAEDSDLATQPIPELLIRCNNPRRRIALFLAGAFLVLISFTFFGPAKQKASIQ